MVDEDRYGEEQESTEQEGEGYDASNPVAVKRRRRSTALAAAQKREFVARILADPIGRAWMWDKLVKVDTLVPKFGASQEATWFLAGAREAGMALLRECMKASPQFTALMFNEFDV